MTRPPRVLLVDDDPEVLRVLARELRGCFGWDVVACASPPRGPLLVDAVVTDLHLENSDGVATLEAVQRAAPGRPVVVLSGLCTPERDAAAIAAGAEAVIPKGEPLTYLAREVRQALDRKRRLVDPEILRDIAEDVIRGLVAAGGLAS